MTQYFNPKLYVRKVSTATDYQAFSDNNIIIYKPNQAQTATVYLENSDGALTDIFAADMNVQLKIEAVVMLDGFVVGKKQIKQANNQRLIELRIVDWGGFLASKMPYQFHYIKAVPAFQLFQDSGTVLTDGTTNLGFGGVDHALSTRFKKDFAGTYVKDVWNDAARVSNADWFVDENKQLQAFELGTKQLIHAGTGNIYSVRDIPPDGANADSERMVLHDAEYAFDHDTTHKFNGVIALNNQVETVPALGTTHFWQTDSEWDDERGYNLSRHYLFMSDAELHKPTFEAGLQIGGDTDTMVPAISFDYGNVGTNSLYCNITFANRLDSTQAGAIGASNPIRIPLGKFEELRFFFYWHPVGFTTQRIELRLYDAANGTWWYRDILPDMLGVDQWTYYRYLLPGLLNNVAGLATSNGWQKSSPGATISNIDMIQFRWTPATGWNEATQAKWSELFFWKRQSATAALTSFRPSTRRLVVSADILDKTSLQNLASNEFRKSIQESKTAYCTIIGDTDFKRPGYVANIDFSATLGTNDFGYLRMSEIEHRIHGGRYTTVLHFESNHPRV